MAASAQAERVLLDGEALRRTIVRIAHELVERNPNLDNTALVGIHTRGVPLRAAAPAPDRGVRRAARSPSEPLDITFHRDDVHVARPQRRRCIRSPSSAPRGSTSLSRG